MFRMIKRLFHIHKKETFNLINGDIISRCTECNKCTLSYKLYDPLDPTNYTTENISLEEYIELLHEYLALD